MWTEVSRSKIMIPTKKAIYFNFCVVQFIPLVFLNNLSASGHKHTSHHAAQHYAQFLCPIDPENSPSFGLFGRLAELCKQ